MANHPNLVGDIYGRLTVISKGGKRGNKRVWNCRCECGNSHEATTSDLRYGGVQSCGCLLKGKTSRNHRHGHSGRNTPSPTYNSWRGMIDRCTNPTHLRYKHYGGRGIVVSDRWLSFENFLADMGERPDGKTIDRINVDGNYEPENCRWATNQEQALNKQNSKPRKPINGEQIDADDAAETVTYQMPDGRQWVDGGKAA